MKNRNRGSKPLNIGKNYSCLTKRHNSSCRMGKLGNNVTPINSQKGLYSASVDTLAHSKKLESKTLILRMVLDQLTSRKTNYSVTTCHRRKLLERKESHKKAFAVNNIIITGIPENHL